MAVPAPGGTLETAPTILVADDEALLVTIISRLLTTWGYRVLSAEDGIEALSLAEAGPVDLLVTDLEMPRMDGISLWQSLRCLWPASRVLFVSGSRASWQLNGDPFLAKPFSPADLRRAVESALQDGSQ